MPKSFDELTFSDDWMFQKVMQDPEVCAELIVYIKDSDKVIDIEIQSYPMEALGKRIRYYESMLNMDCLMKDRIMFS